jgi:hypothetical protein
VSAVMVFAGVWLFVYYICTSRNRGPYNWKHKPPSTSSDRRIAAVLATVVTATLFIWAFVSNWLKGGIS